MHLHSRVSDPLCTPKLPDELFKFSLKVLQARLEPITDFVHSELPYTEALSKPPVRLSGDMCWDGRTDMLDYLVHLGPNDITDIEVALSKFKGIC